MMEVILILATIASRYRLTLIHGHRLRLTTSVTLRPRGGIDMVVHKRERGCGATPAALASQEDISLS